MSGPQDVNITGIDGKTPSQWASEKTAAELLKTTKKIHGKNSEMYDGIKKLIEETKKLHQEQGKIAKDSNRTSQEVADMNAELIRGLSQLDATTKKGISQANIGDGGRRRQGIGGAARLAESNTLEGKAMPSTLAFFDKLTTPTNAFAKAIVAATKSVTGLGGAILGGFAVAIEFFGKQLIAVNTQQRSLVKDGIMLGGAFGGTAGSMNRFTDAVMKSGMNMEQLTKVAKQYGSIVNRVGIGSLVQFGQEIDKTGENLGYTIEESTEFLADYLDRQRVRGTLEEITSQQTRKAAIEQMKVSMNFARALGMSTEDLEKQRKELTKDVDFNSMLQTIPEHLRDKVGTQLETIIGGMGKVMPGIEKHMINYLARGEAALRDPEFQKLMARSPDAVREMMNSLNMIKTGSLGVGQEINAVGGMMGAFKNEFDPEMAKVFMQLGDTSANMLYGWQGSIEEAMESIRLYGKLPSEAKKEDPATAAANQISKMFNAVYNSFKIGFAKMLTDGKFQAALSRLADTIIKAAPAIADSIQKILMYGVPLLEKFANWLAGLVEVTEGKDGKQEVDINWSKLLINPVTMAIAAFKFIPWTIGKILSSPAIGKMLFDAIKGTGAILSKVGTGFFKGMASMIPSLSSMAPFANLAKRLPVIGSIITGLIGVITGISEGWASSKGALDTSVSIFMGVIGGITDAMVDLVRFLAKIVDGAFGLFGMDTRIAEQDLLTKDYSKTLIEQGKFLTGSESTEVQPSRTQVDQSKKTDTPSEKEMKESEKDASQINTASVKEAINSNDPTRLLEELVSINAAVLDKLEDIRRNTRGPGTYSGA